MVIDEYNVLSFQNIIIYSFLDSRIFDFMEPPRLTSQCRARHCSICQGDTEFNCETCKLKLCFSCKERHVVDVNTKMHRVIIYREQFRLIQEQDKCTRHPDMVYKIYIVSYVNFLFVQIVQIIKIIKFKT